MRLLDIEVTVVAKNNLLKNPLIRDNYKNIELDFMNTFNNLLNLDISEIFVEDAIRIKTDLFVSFCHGIRIGVTSSSQFRKGFKLSKEYMNL